MEQQTITVRLPKTTKNKLDSFTKKERLNRSDVVREALRKYFAVQEFRRLRNIMVPQAEAQGFFTDEDVFKQVS